MGLRRKGRELALQMLFAQDRETMRESAIEAFWEAAEAPSDARAFAERMVELVTAHKAELDAAISRSADNWTVDRMSRVDRNLLRLAVCELLYVDTPVNVALDEAVEIAKRYGGDESSRFVNGVLDRAARDLPARPESNTPPAA
ncbi:MAG: transcription antitermination factor NusB [Nitrospirota bacterium]|nr:transcription antitermination factor NusB [Nitrospirota bacterium]